MLNNVCVTFIYCQPYWSSSNLILITALTVFPVWQLKVLEEETLTWCSLPWALFLGNHDWWNCFPSPSFLCGKASLAEVHGHSWSSTEHTWAMLGTTENLAWWEAKWGVRLGKTHFLKPSWPSAPCLLYNTKYIWEKIPICLFPEVLFVLLTLLSRSEHDLSSMLEHICFSLKYRSQCVPNLFPGVPR